MTGMGDDVIGRVEDAPTIAYWMGIPISEMPRAELEREFVAAHQKIAEMRSEIRDHSVAHIRDLAAMKRASFKTSFVHRALDRLSPEKEPK